jgi:ABC-type multidrug transport system fused ATPase/permease subunit
MLKALFKHISKRRKIQFLLLLTLMILGSVAEIVSIGILIPFLGILSGADDLYQNPKIAFIINFFEISNNGQLVLLTTITFSMAVIFSGIVRLVLLYVMTRLSYITGSDISIAMYRNNLAQDFLVHVGRNSSEVVNGMITKSSTVIGGVLVPSLTLINSIILLVFIISMLLFIDKEAALGMFIIIGGVYGITAYFTKRRLRLNSKVIASHTDLAVRYIQEGLGGIRDIIIDNNQEIYCKKYHKIDIKMRLAAASNKFISSSPRYIMEMTGILMVIIFAYIMSRDNANFQTIIPTLGALVFGAQKLLPTFQQLYSSFSAMRGARESFKDVLAILDQPVDKFNECPVTFNKYLQLKDVSFSYSREIHAHLTLVKTNLVIEKGMCVGIVGASGTGKSTMVDIIMGLLEPTQGSLIVDGQCITKENRNAWQSYIAHVPQNIYLSDDSIEANIAFGVPKELINFQQVEKSAKQAGLLEVIEGLEGGYQTIVGEQGLKLSGGQRQRIGIARAFYKKSDLLVLDEATSALDGQTESVVMSEIEGLKKSVTVIIIAHRVTTLKKCDVIIELNKDKTIRSLNYQSLQRNYEFD